MEKMIENATVIPFNMNLRPGKDSVEYFGEFYKHFGYYLRFVRISIYSSIICCSHSFFNLFGAAKEEKGNY